MALLGGTLGCEQIVGIKDPGVFGQGPPGDAFRDDGGSSTDGNLPGLCAPQAMFAPPNNFSASGAKQVAIADLTGDGIPDVAYADGSDIKIYTGTSSGNLGAIRQLTPGTAVNTNGLLVADVDGDGLQDAIATDGQDMASGDTGANTIKVFRQNPPGTFAQVGTTITITASGGMIFVHPAHLNSDGNLDLVVDAQMSTQVFLSTGVGTFGAPTTVDNQLVAIAVLDVDGDGFDDLAFTPGTGGVKLLYTKTQTPGTFDSPVTIGNGNMPALAFGHFSPSSGGRKDAVAGQGIGQLFVQTAPRVFNLTDSSAVLGLDPGGAAGFEKGQVLVADINGDSKDDIIQLRQYAVQCDPLGKFYPDPDLAQPMLMFDMSDMGPRRMALGNLGGTNKLDMVVISDNFLKVYIQ